MSLGVDLLKNQMDDNHVIQNTRICKCNRRTRTTTGMLGSNRSPMRKSVIELPHSWKGPFDILYDAHIYIDGMDLLVEDWRFN